MPLYYFLIMLVITAFAATGQAEQDKMTSNAFDFTFTGIDGQEMPLDQFRGQALLIVNTASQCGFTPQYSALQALWQEYRGEGLVVIGVPSDDFGGQELDNEAAVKAFCTVNFNLDFPLTAITAVKGAKAHDFFQWAGTQAGALARPKWNFHKYLISRDGQLYDWFSSVTDPQSGKMKAAIDAVLR